MTLDMHPRWWRRMVKLFFLGLNLSEDKAEHLIDALPAVEQDRFHAFLLVTGKKPAKALRDLRDNDDLIEKLPRIELEKLAKAGLKRGKLIANLSKMNIEELRELVLLCSYLKNVLVFLTFVDGLDPERKQFLLS
ncbi:MAG: hypothetical protein QMC90_02975 [Dehalococcoidales bacterium]|nr:hypothetical protein [Dehalococcoidales bacterium]